MCLKDATSKETVHPVPMINSVSMNLMDLDVKKIKFQSVGIHAGIVLFNKAAKEYFSFPFCLK